MKWLLAGLCIVLTSCSTIQDGVQESSQPDEISMAIARQTQVGEIVLDWKAIGPLVIRTQIRDILGGRTRTFAYHYQFVFEEKEKGFLAARIDMLGFIPKREEEETVELGSSIADGGFLTRWLPLSFLVSPSGQFIQYYSPFDVERTLEFRKTSLGSRLVSDFPLLFPRKSTELRLYQESISDAALLFRPRAQKVLSYYLLNTKLKQPELVECILVGDSPQDSSTYVGTVELNAKYTTFGEDTRCDINAQYLYDKFENVPSQISLSETYTSSASGRLLLKHQTLVTLTKRSF